MVSENNKKMRTQTKISSIFILITLSLLLFVPAVSAAPTLFRYQSIEQQDSVNQSVDTTLGGASTEASGWVFEGNDLYLVSGTMYLARAAGLTGYVKMVLYENASGISGTLAGQTIIANSTSNIDISLMNVYNGAATYDNLLPYSFTFNNILLDSSKSYYLALVPVGTVGGRIYVGSYSAGTGQGTTIYVTSSGFQETGTYTLCGSIVVDDLAAPTPTPAAPAPTVDPSYGIWGVLSPYSALLLPLIIILVVAIICGKYGGVWGFFAGLNVATILLYVIMGTSYMPLWAIVLLAVVDASLLFGKIGGKI